ncbi:hypothetical protein [uncultured Roseovarius sp.]|uniref:hypothetical protein n=1 Tax=uncultured Roseovarius sp. TaxID=293344 RepID=UPI0025E4C7D2|nr:hypothetical protein [uncultured Roseovarius sp.]
MVAFPDGPNTFSEDRLSRGRASVGCALKRGIKMGVGTALLMAAVGMWAVPAGDAAMQMIKLFVSVCMLGLGLMLISALDQTEDMPEVHLDTLNRQLRVVTTDACGNLRLREVYDLDALSEVSLEGHALTACDATGQQIVSIRLPDAETEKALRGLLPQAA